MNNKIIRYSLPTKIVDSNRPLGYFKCLLSSQDDQISLNEENMVQLHQGDYFVLDFGEEMCGGIRILTGLKDSIYPNMKIHIRFGESISEACSSLGEKGSCNDHSVRDFVAEVPALSDQQFGDTGFRFVRIDILEENTVVHPFKSIYSWEFDYQYKVLNIYKSKDPLINEIYNTCLRTLTLCMQNRIWDGIKRDRLVWIGDMEPEIHAILYAYGNIEIVKKTLLSAMSSNKMPCWINGIPSYSAWFLLIMYDLFEMAKDYDFIKEHRKYLDDIIDLFNKSIIYNNLDYDLVGLSYGMKYFIDWASYKNDNEQERKDANILLLKYILIKVTKMYQSLGFDQKQLTELVNKVNDINVEVPKTKVFAAFYQLLYKDNESYKVLIKDNSKGMSTFMSYYVLKAVSQVDNEKAVSMLKEYYGGMLKLGATTFFEDFDIDWVKESYRIDEINNGKKKDLHGDHGDHCYKGFRHSLCHGWSAGPISFLFEEDIK